MDQRRDRTDQADRPTRRRVLAALGTAALAGCAGLGDTGTGDATPTLTPAPATEAAVADSASGSDPDPDRDLASHGIPPDICEETIHPDPGIYAVDDPAFAADWQGRDVASRYRYADDRAGLNPDQPVVGLTDDGRARAYPLEVLWHHEVVTDEFGGPVVVTYCPLCRSAVVAEARVDGEPTTFGVTGLLWQPERVWQAASEDAGRVVGVGRDDAQRIDTRHNGNLVMYDTATRSYWSQVLARAICGPQTGTRMSIRPFSLATWGDWRADHPGTDVLLPPPHSGIMETNG